jgi:hypothetical protein
MPVPPAMSADMENLRACHRISQLAPVNTYSALCVVYRRVRTLTCYGMSFVTWRQE